ncbi:zinc-binding dehydrogenase [Planosporangium thailandense]|uniref:Zinc-binding dehydrogenase n=2 Tax=Planosporangium thailandense TaxID=765197 RepID=A0ABX0XV24_9ACTN|nr:alcohol dehydrogenase family protein [Planosporangium thailandense]NJC69870.1 zinc-binding dehydrogenase [Planosporangium thailandense]
MRGVVLTGHGGLDKLSFRDDLIIPEPGAGEVLVKVGACGVNNTDINTRTGWYDRVVASELTEDFGVSGREGSADAPQPTGDDAASWNTNTVTFPRISGAATAGTIVAVGDGVDPSRVGERVLVDPCVRDTSLPKRAQLVEYLGSERDGGFAEYIAVPAENALSISSNLSDAELATFPCSYDTAEEMLARAELQAGETVLVTGAAGGVGTALLQLAHIRGATVVAVASASKEQRIRSLGADHFIPRETDDLESAVRDICGDRGVDVVADVVGGPAFGSLLKILRRGGRYTTAGAIAGPLETIDLRDLIYKDLEMYGITCPTSETFRRIVSLVESGELKPMLEQSFSLEQLGEAQAQFVKRQHVGKFVIVP